MTILITGAFGFVGTNLSAYLAAKGHELWALDLLRPQSGRNDECKNGAYSRCFGWEKLEEIPWGEVDAVVHLAGKAHDTKNASDPKSYFDINVGLTKKIVSSLVHYCESVLVDKPVDRGQRPADCKVSTHALMNSRTNELPKFILFSSVKAVADRVEGVLTEDAVPDPQTPYGQSKLEAERAVLKCGSSKVRQSEEVTANSANFANGEKVGTLELANIRTYILRPCMIHGPGNKGNLNLLYGVVKKGLPWPLGVFDNRRSFASVENVCAVVEGLLTRDVTSGVYQVADDEPLSTNDLIGLMARLIGREARIWRLPAKLIRLVARCGDILRLPLNSERLKKLTESYVASNAKIKAALGWERMPVNARDGMRITLESFSRKDAKELKA